MSIKFYEVLEDGTLQDDKDFTSDSTKVVIIVDDQFKRLFLWKGVNSGIKKKFIGSRAAAELRKTYYGFAYRLSVIEEGDETQEFEFTIKRSRGEVTVGVIEEASTRGIPTNPSEMGLESDIDIRLRGQEPSKKIIYTDRDKADTSQFAGSRSEVVQKPEGHRAKPPQPEAPQPEQRVQPQRTILSEMMSGKEPVLIRPAPGTEAAKRFEAKTETITPKQPQAAMPKPPPPPTASATPPKPSTQKMLEEVDPKYAFEMLRELGLPKGYERDLVIVGTGVYKQQGNEFLVPPNPPEGVFLAPDRVPRIIIENGVVKVIEVLKKIEKHIDEKEEVQLDQGIEDLMNTFQIELE